MPPRDAAGIAQISVGSLLGGFTFFLLTIFIVQCIQFGRRKQQSNNKSKSLSSPTVIPSSIAIQSNGNLQARSRQNANDRFINSSAPRPHNDMGFTCITAENFEKKFENMKRRQGILAEFDRLEAAEENFEKAIIRADAGQEAQNQSRNRYNDVLAKDHTRVKLKGGDHDYVNANFINGYKCKHQFICAQGPTGTTIPDFWRMIWEARSLIIVMITNLTEDGRNKCAKYWPEAVGDQCVFGDFLITYVNDETEQASEAWIVRKFKVTQRDAAKELEVYQFQYTKWADHDVPLDVSHVFAYIEAIERLKEKQKSDAPITVHCSAGLGRSGVFIAIVIGVQQFVQQNKVDIYNTVLELRRQRAGMVQVSRQYQFIYESLLWYYKNRMITDNDMSKK